MEVEASRSNIQTTSFVGSPSRPPCENAAFNTSVHSFHNYHEFDEAVNWIELESKTRSVRYHLSECIEYQKAAFPAPIDDQPAASSRQHGDRIVRYDNETMSRNAWRSKVASDMALSGLSTMEHILNMLHVYRNGRESVSIVRDLTNWFLLMSASYAIRTLHYSPPIDTTANATLLLSSCLALRSTCQLFHIGIRSLVITRCQNIITSLMFQVLTGDLCQHDVDSLHGYWFRGLGLFKIEERLSMPLGREAGTPYERFAQRPLPASGYVIPEDD